MSTLPPELAALSSAASDEEKRRALTVAMVIVALAGRARRDAVVGALVALGLAGVAEVVAAVLSWPAPGRHFAAAVALCVTFPLATRLVHRNRLLRVRRRFAGANVDETWRQLAPEVAAAWERASPGQRAAVIRIAKTST